MKPFRHPTKRMVVFKDGTYEEFPSLKEADLTDADFSYADLRGENFKDANLIGATFFKANLTGANLSGADLMIANFTGATLDDANLEGANLFDTNLDGCSLLGANVLRSNLRCAKLSGATGFFPFFLPNVVAEEITGGKPSAGIFVVVTIIGGKMKLVLPTRNVALDFDEAIMAFERKVENKGQKKVLMLMMQAAQEWASLQRIN